MWSDLDNFKLVNESLGHAAGDELLVALASRLRQPGAAHRLARYSGDSFAAIVPGADQATVALIAQEALAQLQTTLQVHGHAVSMSASVGIAVHPDDAKTTSALESAAEVAMYRVKQDGRNGLRFLRFRDGGAHPALAGDCRQHQGKRRTVASCAWYQPQRALGSGALVGPRPAALAPPAMGAGVAGRVHPDCRAECGAILAIDFWVIEAAARQVRAWDAAGLPPIVVAVNVSAAQFARPQFVDELAAGAAPPGCVAPAPGGGADRGRGPEIPRAGRNHLRRLHEAGLRVALDDFGTGYSSMSYLKRYAIDKLKIDQSFVRELADQTSDQAIVTAIVRMAQSPHMATLARAWRRPSRPACCRTWAAAKSRATGTADRWSRERTSRPLPGKPPSRPATAQPRGALF